MTQWNIPFGMFDIERTADEARRAEKLKNIYHRGQDLAWDGRKVLSALLEKHGGIQVEPAIRDALGRVLTVLLWGELAAWRISAQLADRIETLEPKMAATSQAHDEARHFYVLYDYMKALGVVPGPIHGPGRSLLEGVVSEDDLTHKLVGMQLMIETIALTIFQALRESRIEPVLADLLVNFEKDEARHVGLGVQYVPERLRGIGVKGFVRLTAFQLRIVYWTLAQLKTFELDLRLLSIDPRDVVRLGRGKQQQVNDAMWANLGLTNRPIERGIQRVVDSISEMLFPPAGAKARIRDRLGAARNVWRKGGIDVVPGQIAI